MGATDSRRDGKTFVDGAMGDGSMDMGMAIAPQQSGAETAKGRHDRPESRSALYGRQLWTTFKP